MTGDKDVRTCFVIMPFHTKKDAARKDKIDFDKVYEEIIKPAVEGLKERGIRINCVRSDKIERAGLIHERMIAHIVEADVTVVDITTDNPNVFYELGIRHALRDRVTVLMRRKGKPNPFNVGGMTTIEYDIDKQNAGRAGRAWRDQAQDLKEENQCAGSAVKAGGGNENDAETDNAAGSSLIFAFYLGALGSFAMKFDSATVAVFVRRRD